MPTGNAILLHPASARRPTRARRARALGEGLLLAAAILAGGTVAVALTLLLLVVSAPLGAGVLAWLAWRSREALRAGPEGERARIRRRARALGLVVLAGSLRPVR